MLSGKVVAPFYIANQHYLTVFFGLNFSCNSFLLLLFSCFCFLFVRLNGCDKSNHYHVSRHRKPKSSQKPNSSSSRSSRDQSCKRSLITAINKSWRTNAFQATLHQHQSAALVRHLSEKPTFPLGVLFHFLISRRLWSVGRKL